MLWTPGKYSRHTFFMFLLLLLKWKWLLRFSISSFQLNKSRCAKGFHAWKEVPAAGKQEWPLFAPTAQSACSSRPGLLHISCLFLVCCLGPSLASVSAVLPTLTEREGVPKPLGIPCSLAAGSYHNAETICVCALHTRTSFSVSALPWQTQQWELEGHE